ncbi:hypothetical protein EYE40_00285 [Glaciihabitans arcticus]|uniref:LGFP repeat-containing protein n=1 Tax=Glaciihabitans arcticus TaxID=2668039 RepID=A0A4Q9GMN8_9MICO|nr:hypothetical protein [Glaciihabitans arcticus]TBN55956.1 hypothetical protein EYE40_00285 [Glaciihabitans arcticus]
MTIISSRIRRLGVRVTAILAATVVLSSGLVGVTSASAAPESVAVDAAPVVTQVEEISRAAAALSGTNFNPGYIVSDWSFYNANGMSQAKIQAFLDAKCPTNNCIDTKKMKTTARAATNMCPSPYAASASETFAAIIYKVQRSCGISAKVILVTLQKEQGLLNLQNPTDLKLRKAMGMGCPDTSVCDSKYYGFFNQVYYGASQLKRYGLRTADNVSFRTKYQIGVPYKVSYKPNSTCGTRTVTVKSKATTALYYYTPYTPNAKALANLTGLGDSCSSYGNRNFWVYFNSWFGNSLAGPGNFAIDSAYEASGGAAGPLGAKGPETSCVDNRATCSQVYTNGMIYWTLSGGPLVISGAIGTYFLANGGINALGIPTGPGAAVTDPNGNGTVQPFAKGMVHSSSAGTFFVSTAVLTAYSAAGWLRGTLGWPTTDRGCATATSGCVQTFTGGYIYAPATGAALRYSAAVASAYTAAGGQKGAIGLPLAAPSAVVDKVTGNGTAQSFQGGWIHSSVRGAFSSSTKMMTAYSARKWVRGPLGWPIAAETCASDGTCSQPFAGATLNVPTTGATFLSFSVTDPKIATLYSSLGGESGSLGEPVAQSGPVVEKVNGDGVMQKFEQGIVHSSAKGTFAVPATIMPTFSATKWVRGPLGWPTGPQVCGSDGSCAQPFAGGTIQDPASGVPFATYTVVNTKIKAAYTAAGGEAGSLGKAITVAANVIEKTNGNGVYQSFEGGAIHSSALGTFVVSKAMMAKYSAKKWVRGVLGWPKANAVCTAANVCTQAFKGGTLTTP